MYRYCCLTRALGICLYPDHNIYTTMLLLAYKNQTNRLTGQSWHEMLFFYIRSWCSYLWTLDVRQFGRHLIQQLLMTMKQLLVRTQHLLSGSTCSLNGLKQVFVVGTLARCLNSWLTVDDHETAREQQTENSHRNHSRLVLVCLFTLIIESLSDCTPM